ncbi:TPA: hypothetical protein MAJ58_005209 [Klebsiella pneumoniae]|uniref:hypothetical protein n=1 Tax=Klebsiella pneumoniae TaxID=573 RepID=UPI00227AE992|nr:hypothetical protein [Klebsiella pneumoniae]MCY3442864.1 hypothetical protein [Klebsiella pneumoniae]HBS5460039.1 hypothetical protein [Klebsiella pneumoniae]HBT7403221.1 hypothetical protein [Klebsiella pneumoniae]HBV9667210.1 hypothetical protein [Klebsiella pneumoniae]
MTTDITELAQREKFEAWAEEVGALPWGILKKHRNQDGSYPGPHYTYMWKAWQAASAELVEALEKAQAKADVYDMLRDEYGLREKGVGLADFVDWQAKRIAELDSHKAALLKFISDSCYIFDGFDADISDAYVDAITSGLMPKLESVAACNPPLFWVRVKSDGGYDGPIHDSKLEDVRKKSGECLPLTLARGVPEQESRTVTVKLTDINEYLAEVHDKTLNRAFRLLAEGVRAGDVAAMRAAGIKVEAE